MKKYSLLVFLILILIGCSTEEITEEPLDVEPVDNLPIKKSVDPTPIEKEILDIEDPW